MRTHTGGHEEMKGRKEEEDNKKIPLIILSPSFHSTVRKI